MPAELALWRCGMLVSGQLFEVHRSLLPYPIPLYRLTACIPVMCDFIALCDFTHALRARQALHVTLLHRRGRFRWQLGRTIWETGEGSIECTRRYGDTTRTPIRSMR